MIATDKPFVLLDDARAIGASPSRLYANPVRCLTANTLAEIRPLLDELAIAGAEGLHAAGFIAYDAGAALLPQQVAQPNGPLAWFGLFERFETLDANAMTSLLPDPAGAWLSPFRPEITRAEYEAAFKAVQDYIKAGDIYQANLTFPVSAHYAGHPLALYAALRPRAAAGYGGVIWTGDAYHLSFSPELFFALKGRTLTTRPMKGTAPRRLDPHEDAQAAAALGSDPKQRAENLMIVDLLRNDLSQICTAGSVAVPELFRIESYPTVHQMTSTVTGKLDDDRNAVDVIAALFPCGSITGAPKIRAMQVISEVERRPRSLYCGSIGRIDADDDAAFNVAIRTLSLCEATKRVSLGLGSGVVADSVEADEWAECLAKGDFAKLDDFGFDLIETMRFEPASGLIRLERHLERMTASARAFGFEFDRHEARNCLHAATFHLDALAKVRLLASRGGALSVETGPLEDVTEWRVAITDLPVSALDCRLRHKISDRAFYDDARKARKDCDEIVFVTADGHLTEGSISALFVKREGRLLTPRLETGLLPSVLRQQLIDEGQATETDLTQSDLDGEFYLGNSVRGLILGRRVA